jgi:hypothetical protein
VRQQGRRQRQLLQHFDRAPHHPLSLLSFVRWVRKNFDQVVTVPVLRVTNQSVSDGAEHGARGLASRLSLSEVLDNGRAGGEARVPGTQACEFREPRKLTAMNARCAALPTAPTSKLKMKHAP